MAEQTSSESKDDIPEVSHRLYAYASDCDLEKYDGQFLLPPLIPQRKRRRKRCKFFCDVVGHAGEDEEDANNSEPKYPWEGTDRDYFYEELLSRVFHILRENNPELAGDRRRTVIRPPQVLREGTKKTVFVNFMDLCRTMHRQPDHVMTFLLAEMGTSGSLDGQQRLVVKGRFAPKNFEGILRRYISKSCSLLLLPKQRFLHNPLCMNMSYAMAAEVRIQFFQRRICGSGRSVAPIKTGFVARVGRRKAGS
ncbi:hypothetical protein Ccrd_002906, partial [Cynara cardunculus var. scolymus]